jgi:hypothetical protein
MAIQRVIAVTVAFVIEAVLILAVVLSSIGIASDARPTPGSPMQAPIPSH